jgi:hypothetical protein
LALTISAPLGITRYISYVFSLSILLIKLWLLRIMIYYGALRLPYDGVDDYSDGEEEEMDDDGMTVWEGIEPLTEEDEPSVSTAADAGFVAELDEQKVEGGNCSPLLLDVAGGDVSILLRPAAGLSSANFIEIELNGEPVERDVQAFHDGTFLVEFKGRSAGGRVSIFAL